MLEKIYPMKLNDDYYVCLGNELILGRQKTMSIWANRLLNFLVMQLVSEDIDVKTYTVRVQDLAKFIGIPADGKMYKYIKDAVFEIKTSAVEIGNADPKKPWKALSWLGKAEYDGDGTLTLALSDDVKPYLFELKKRGWFTQFQIKEILPMNSFYAIRLYQYITLTDKKSRNNLDYIEISIKELREYFDCTNKLKQIGEFKKSAIEIAVNQINNNLNSEYWIDLEYIKTGRTVTHVRFHLHYGKIRRLSLGGDVGE